MDELSNISKAELITALLAERQKRAIVDKSSIVARLKNAHKQYTSNHERFKSGDLIVWKEGLKNKKLPQENVPAIVVEHLEVPILNSTESSGSAYFRESLDLLAGFIDDDGDFIIFHFDSKRFKKYSEA